MSNTPKLRFPEFSGEWEEKRLSDIASFSKGKGYTKNDLVNDGSPIILYGRMYTKYETVISDIDTFVNLQEGSIISKGGEIIVPASGETAEEISRASVVKNKGIILGGDLNILSLQKDKYNPEFFALTISSGTSQKRLSKLAQGKSVVHLHNEDLSGLQIKVPSLPEQQKIADFLSNVDSIITAETKILNTLQKKKKALMQKLFTQQLRFKSDDGTDFPAWEERKLGDVCDIIGGGTPDTNKAEYWNGNIQWFTPTEIGNTKYISESKRKITQLGFEKSSAKLLPVGTILFTSRATLGEMSITTVECTTNQGFQSLIPNKNFVHPDYLYYLQPILQKYCYSKASGSTFLEISAKSLKECHIPLPCKAEQQKIADCLSSMDSLIQTQQKVVTTWQQRKKALLQQMFI